MICVEAKKKNYYCNIAKLYSTVNLYISMYKDCDAERMIKNLIAKFAYNDILN